MFLFISFLNIHAFAQNENVISSKLFDELKDKDSALFNAAFNTCDINVVENILGSDFTFYQDKGEDIPADSQNRIEFINYIKDHFCGADKNASSPKMKREIEAGTLRVYPVSATAVLQTGMQDFYELDAGANPQLMEVSRFTRTWNKVNDDWKMNKEFDAIVLNYHPTFHNALYDTIAHMDSLLFDAFNHQNLKTLQTYFTTDLEFYHDKDGLKNYDQNMKAFADLFSKNNGLIRTLVPGSLKVYPCPNYGAMEIGEHTFTHKENGQVVTGTFGFAMVWKEENGTWKISRVLSYGHESN